MSKLVFHFEASQKKSRLKVLFRPISALPFAIILSLLGTISIFTLFTPLGTKVIEEIKQSYSTNATNDTITYKTPPEENITRIQDSTTQSTPLDKTDLQEAQKTSNWKTLAALYAFAFGLPYYLFLMLMAVDAFFRFFIPLSIALPLDLLILFQRSYPIWIYPFITNIITIVLRYKLYVFSITDTYPSFTHSDPKLTLILPEWKEPKSRYMPITRRISTLPHIIIVSLLETCLLIIYTPLWIFSVITGRLPLWYQNMVMGLLRWSLRVHCYSVAYISNQYPPFSTKGNDSLN